jgi:hypothetical protein
MADKRRPIAGIIDLAQWSGRHRAVISTAMKHPFAPPGAMTAIGPVFDAEDAREFAAGLSKGKRHRERDWRPAPYGPADPRGYVAVSDIATILIAEQRAADGDRSLLELWDADPATARRSVPKREMTTKRELVSKVLGRDGGRRKHNVRLVELRAGTLYYPQANVMRLLHEPRPAGRAGWQSRTQPALPPPPPYVPARDREDDSAVPARDGQVHATV